MKIFSRSRIRLSPLDALRALLGREVTVHTDIEVSCETEVLSSVATVTVAKVFPGQPKPEQAMVVENPAA